MTWRLLTRALVVAGGVAMCCLLAPSPAVAHPGGGAEPSNYRVRVTGTQPAVPGLAVTVGSGGQWVRVTAPASATVTVLGYAGEPFLQLTPQQVRVNRQSTTLADNPGLSARPLPPSPRPQASPQWVGAESVDVAGAAGRSGPVTSVTWEDARIDRVDSTGSGGNPGKGRWQLPLLVEGEPVTVEGNSARVAPPSPWPAMAAGAAIALVAAGVGWIRRWRVPAGTLLAATVAAYGVHLVGVARAAEPGAVLAAWGPALGVAIVCAPLLVVAVAALWRRSEHASIAVAIAAAVLAILTVGDLPVLWHSQLPFAWSAGVERALVVCVLGAAAGLVVAGLRHLDGGASNARGSSAPETGQPPGTVDPVQGDTT